MEASWAGPTSISTTSLSTGGSARVRRLLRLFVPITFGVVARVALSAPARAQGADPTAKDSLADVVKEKPAEAKPVEANAADAKSPQNAPPGYLPGYRRAMGLGLSPYAPQTPGLPGGLTIPFSAPAPNDDWTFNFWGYMSAALRVGRGERPVAGPDQYEPTL